MPLYPVRCPSCGHAEDQVLRMPPGDEMPDYQPCSVCGHAVCRVFTVPNEISGNTWHPQWSSNLSDGPDPVYVSTRDQYYDILRRRGERPVERGEVEASVKTAMERRNRATAARNKAISDRMDRAFDRALAEKGGVPS